MHLTAQEQGLSLLKVQVSRWAALPQVELKDPVPFLLMATQSVMCGSQSHKTYLQCAAEEEKA